MTKHSWTPVIG